MKRTISLLLCLCLLTVLTVSAAATDFVSSPTQSASVTEVVVTDPEGNPTEVSEGSVTVTPTTEDVDVSGVDVPNPVVGDVFEITATDEIIEALENGSTVTVTISLSGSTDQLAEVLQLVDGVWVSVPFTITDIGEVMVPLSGLGPIAFIYEGETGATTGTGVSATTGGSVPTSPKTGESLNGGILATGAVIILLAAGAAVVYRKKLA